MKYFFWVVKKIGFVTTIVGSLMLLVSLGSMFDSYSRNKPQAQAVMIIALLVIGAGLIFWKGGAVYEADFSNEAAPINQQQLSSAEKKKAEDDKWLSKLGEVMIVVGLIAFALTYTMLFKSSGHDPGPLIAMFIVGPFALACLGIGGFLIFQGRHRN